MTGGLAGRSRRLQVPDGTVAPTPRRPGGVGWGQGASREARESFGQPWGQRVNSLCRRLLILGTLARLALVVGRLAPGTAAPFGRLV